MTDGRYNYIEGREKPPQKGGVYILKTNDHEVQIMSNNQSAALVKAIRIIYDLANPEQFKSALEEIQSTLEQSK